jgi:hypothetical protein
MALINQRQQDRARPMDELNSMTQGLGPTGGVPGGTGGGPGVGNVDIMGAAQQGYGNQMAGYNAQQARQQGNTQSAASLAAMAAMYFSDPDLKEAVHEIGGTEGGTPIFDFRYKGDPVTRVGFMADRVPPEAVRRHPSGFRVVDYSKVP